MQKHPGEMRARQFIPPLFVTVLILSLLTMPFVDGSRIIFVLTVASYVVVNLAASVLAASRTAGPRARALSALLPIVFATIHISYGLGFLLGLAKFWNRWGNRKNRPERLDRQNEELGQV